jgi:hypothetical protein
MVQDQLRDFSTSWHGKNMHEEILDLQENISRVTQVEEQLEN